MVEPPEQQPKRPRRTVRYFLENGQNLRKAAHGMRTRNIITRSFSELALRLTALLRNLWSPLRGSTARTHSKHVFNNDGKTATQ